MYVNSLLFPRLKVKHSSAYIREVRAVRTVVVVALDIVGIVCRNRRSQDEL